MMEARTALLSSLHLKPLLIFLPPLATFMMALLELLLQFMILTSSRFLHLCHFVQQLYRHFPLILLS